MSFDLIHVFLLPSRAKQRVDVWRKKEYKCDTLFNKVVFSLFFLEQRKYVLRNTLVDASLRFHFKVSVITKSPGKAFSRHETKVYKI